MTVATPTVTQLLTAVSEKLFCLGIVVAHIFALDTPKTRTNKRHINGCVIYARISMRTDH